MVMKFCYKGLLFSTGSGSRGVRQLFLINAVLAFTNFLLDCNYPVGGGI